MYIGIDVGGTKTAIGLFEETNEDLVLLDEKTIKTPDELNDAIKEIAGAVTELRDNKEIGGIGVGVPGSVNDEGRLSVCPQLPGWTDKSLKEIFESELDASIVVENDAVSAAFGEAMYGEGRGAESFLFIVWGTGVGGSFVEKDGDRPRIRPVELGHQSIDWNGVSCTCGQKGCLEEYIGGKSFARRYKLDPANMNQNDPVWAEIADKAAFGIYNTLIHHPTSVVIFSGGVILKQAHLLGKIDSILKQRMKFYSPPEIRTSRFKEKGGMYGAATLAQTI